MCTKGRPSAYNGVLLERRELKTPENLQVEQERANLPTPLWNTTLTSTDTSLLPGEATSRRSSCAINATVSYG
jgi:hypothetical protein